MSVDGDRARAGTLDALIFDVDGTMADTEELHRRAFNEIFHEAGLSWRWEPALYRQLLMVTGGKERIAHYVRAHLGDAPARFAIADLHARKTERYARLLERGAIGLRPGVARIISEARARGLTLAIATTTSPANVDALIASTLGAEARGWFAAVAAGDCVARKKPAPDVYEVALAALGAAPDRCVALEDSANGLRAARAAGVPTVITINDDTRDQDFSGAAAVVSDLGEPDAPLREIAGVSFPRGYVDVDGLEAVLSCARTV
ncbi:MAG: HAD-IA family hydrolase [Caulobacterales bacterium]|nr:HAD-IA family hydrolase [Caulobacterales bacterium]